MRLTPERQWVRIIVEAIFCEPFIRIKNMLKVWKTLTVHCCNCYYANYWRVDIEERLAYKTHLHGLEWWELSADWDQCPIKNFNFLQGPRISPGGFQVDLRIHFRRSRKRKRILRTLLQAASVRVPRLAAAQPDRSAPARAQRKQSRSGLSQSKPG